MTSPNDLNSQNSGDTVISVTVTPEQRELLSQLYNPYVKTGDQPGQIYVYEIRDDSYVRQLIVDPDGSYTYEALNNGLGGGWTAFDQHGRQLDWETREIIDDGEHDEMHV